MEHAGNSFDFEANLYKIDPQPGDILVLQAKENYIPEETAADLKRRMDDYIKRLGRKIEVVVIGATIDMSIIGNTAELTGVMVARLESQIRDLKSVVDAIKVRDAE